MIKCNCKLKSYLDGDENMVYYCNKCGKKGRFDFDLKCDKYNVLPPKDKALEIYNYFLLDSNFISGMDTNDVIQYAEYCIIKCKEVHYNLNGDSNGIGESFKYWSDVHEELIRIKINYENMRSDKRVPFS